MIFVDIPYREGSHPIFRRYNQAYARKFASFWDIAPYQEGSSNYPNVPLWVSSLRPIVMGLGLNSAYVRCRVDTVSLPQAAVYLLSSFTSNYIHTRKIAQWIRQHHPQSKIILGGSHATACGLECAETGDFDAIVAGEGEEALHGVSVVGEPVAPGCPGRRRVQARWRDSITRGRGAHTAPARRGARRGTTA